jgi:hypothetical protein
MATMTESSPATARRPATVTEVSSTTARRPATRTVAVSPRLGWPDRLLVAAVVAAWLVRMLQ